MKLLHGRHIYSNINREHVSLLVTSVSIFVSILQVNTSPKYEEQTYYFTTEILQFLDITFTLS